MAYVVCIDVPTGYGRLYIVRGRARSLAGSAARRRGIELRDTSIVKSLEPMHGAIYIQKLSGHIAGRIDAERRRTPAGGRTGTRNIEALERAVPGANETMRSIIVVNRVSGDRAAVIDAGANGADELSRSSARAVE